MSSWRSARNSGVWHNTVLRLMRRQILITLALLFLFALVGCNFPLSVTRIAPTPAASVVLSPVELPTLVNSRPPTVIAVAPTTAPTMISTVALVSSLTPIPEPAGCQRPPDDYTHVMVNGEQLNRRTLWMLQHAQTLYGGSIDFAGTAVTQGSYNPGGVSASFGTHDRGGAVDLSVLDPHNGHVLRDELPAAIHALRVAGFAAWVREYNELYNGSPLHIHAIAIGDAELSPAAQDQLTGMYGYFLGFNGLPKADNIPVADRHGGPILCNWMRDMGYKDLR